VFEFAANIKPLLMELDASVPVTEPVRIETLIELTKKHSAFDTIRLSPINKPSIVGLHVAFPDQKLLHIYYRACGVHPLGGPIRQCPECRDARFTLAKELSHAFDCQEERTSAAGAEDMFLKGFLRGSLTNAAAVSDMLGTVWAGELLIRYCHRVALIGGGVFPVLPSLASAKRTGDFSYFAEQFCVPIHCAKAAFEDDVMKVMETVRERVGLPVR